MFCCLVYRALEWRKEPVEGLVSQEIIFFAVAHLVTAFPVPTVWGFCLLSLFSLFCQMLGISLLSVVFLALGVGATAATFCSWHKYLYLLSLPLSCIFCWKVEDCHTWGCVLDTIRLSRWNVSVTNITQGSFRLAWAYQKDCPVMQ